MIIDDNIPIPRTRRKDKSRYKFYMIGVGQSCFYPGNDKLVNNIRSALSEWKKHNGGDFVTEARIENKIEGVRIWRAV